MRIPIEDEIGELTYIGKNVIMQPICDTTNSLFNVVVGDSYESDGDLAAKTDSVFIHVGNSKQSHCNLDKLSIEISDVGQLF
ncbi:MAG: hypothetical protein EOP45_13215 [Sphingobacteriaceae bacterium]|nr:MAG: hypothetical protein EOP45_13215 [Sphingobacteriaceae bacterium]